MSRGHALVSYLAQPLLWPEAATRLKGHSNAWESTEISRVFRSLGYTVDAIDWNDDEFTPTERCDVMLDIHCNLARLAPIARTKILHATGSYPGFSNLAELERVRAAESRRGVAFRSRRQVDEDVVRKFDESLEVADIITLIGNRKTLETYPTSLHAKIKLISPSASWLGGLRSAVELPPPKEFLWFGGAGAIHKGLDLVLEVFANNPRVTLHCVGPYERELDFIRAYRRELFELPNVRSHGYLLPSSPEFTQIAARCTALIMPSCSEGISTSVATCLQFGFVPIISDRCGIDLPPEGGWQLKDCSTDAIEGAIQELCKTPLAQLRQAAESCQQFALAKYSRSAFTAGMRGLLADQLRIELGPDTAGTGLSRSEYATSANGARS